VPVNYSPSAGVPKSYLRGQFFDKNGNFVRAVPIVPLLTNTGWQYMTFNFEAEAEGTLQIFVANQSNASVWYDDMQITWDKPLIAQENHYYPFGMNMVGIEKKGNPEDRFQFMGAEKNSDFNLHWIETDWRGYDAQLGRFHQIDLLADEYPGINPYQYAYNTPSNVNDPSGLCVGCPENGTKNQIFEHPDSGITYLHDGKGWVGQLAAVTISGSKPSGGSSTEGNASSYFWAAMDFSLGFSNSMNNNLTNGLVARVDPINSYVGWGALLGDIASLFLGGGEIVGGTSVMIGSATLEIGSAGTASLIAVPAGLASAALTTHGVSTTSNAAGNLMDTFRDPYGRLYARKKDNESNFEKMGNQKRSSVEKMPDDVAKELGIDKNEFSDYIHMQKKDRLRRPTDNFTWDDLIELGKELLKSKE
jgi:RHS repeat-associated protein